MKRFSSTSLAMVCVLAFTVAGCAISRDQSTFGEYVDDATVTARVKAKFVEDKGVSTNAINVETLRGTVQLSGFAKSESEKNRAATLARATPGARTVINDIVVKP